MYYFEPLEGLYKNKVRYLIAGGLSVNLYGVPRVTQDIDIIIAMDRENVLKITSLLKELDYVSRLPVNPDDLANPDKVKDIEIYLASIDDVIKMKEFSGRTQDFSDIEMLRKVRKYLEGKNG